MKRKMMIAVLAATVLLSACGQENNNSIKAVRSEDQTESTEVSLEQLGSSRSDEAGTEELFTDRDMQQTPDLTDAKYISVLNGKDINIDTEGVYVLSGSAENVTVYVETDDKAKVQLVLDGLEISNTDSPCIYVKSADKVFLTTVSDDNELTVSGSFSSDGDTNTDAVIFSKDDLVLNGTGVLTINSSDNGISGKDDIKLTGGTWEIACSGSAIEAHDEILVADGKVEITACNDGLHAENNEDDTTGYVYIAGGTIDVKAADDGIHATTAVKIDDGDIVLTAAEGIEGTQIEINGGNIEITASDDGINAARKSSALNPLFEMNGGNVSISMGAGDTDGVDSNGDIRINGGTISITGQSTFDYDGNAEYNGGTIIENGKETDTISNQMVDGRGGRGGMAPDGGFERNGAQWNGKDFEDMKPEDNMGGRRGRGMNRQGTGEL
ncbi:MAG: carbohydrate-binding domain-containing protein [Lachnospiraceae bacterium]|nr:carbohydrate-binding domain-containing protein [Lachnospiraceae bacterium]